MADLTYREYSAGFVLLIFSVAMISNFSGSIFKTYNANVSSETLQQIKSEAQSANPAPGTYSNRTQKIDIEESSFLSPRGFGIIQDVLASVGRLGSIADTATSELGFPGAITFLIAGLITIGLIFQALSSLFGYNV